MSPLCTVCKAFSSEALPPPRRFRVDDGDWERLFEVLCHRCGRILPTAPQPAVLATFSVLARFGLTDSGRPILDVPAGHPAQFWPGERG
jgi:hypothetical protein